MAGADPEGAADDEEGRVPEHGAADHGDEVGDPDKVDGREEPLGEIEGYHHGPGCVEGRGDIEGITDKTDHDEKDGNPTNVN